MKITKNISGQEVIPNEVWNRYGRFSLRFIDLQMVKAHQEVRSAQGSARYMNTWSLNNPPEGLEDRNESGLRIPGMTTFRETSIHSYGKAGDSVSTLIPHAELFEDILKNPKKYWKYGFKCIEGILKAPTWLHGDTRDFDNLGNPITELMITDKIEGQWKVLTVPEYREATKL